MVKCTVMQGIMHGVMHAVVPGLVHGLEHVQCMGVVHGLVLISMHGLNAWSKCMEMTWETGSLDDLKCLNIA
jgi:hypothetical protein